MFFSPVLFCLHRYGVVCGLSPRSAGVLLARSTGENREKKSRTQKMVAATTFKAWSAAIYYIFVMGFRWDLISE